MSTKPSLASVLLSRTWKPYTTCRGCRHRYSGPEELFCTLTPGQAQLCPEILSTLTAFVEETFDPEQAAWLATHNLFDPEGLALVKYSSEFFTPLPTAVEHFDIWRQVQSITSKL